jgi:hypothetical protein
MNENQNFDSSVMTKVNEIGAGVAPTISEDSDLSEMDESELNITSPPLKSALQKQSAKLKIKYQTMRHALIDEQIETLEKHIEQVRSGDHPRIKEALSSVEARKREQLKMLEERKKFYYSRISNVYRAACQAAIQDYQVSIID